MIEVLLPCPFCGQMPPEVKVFSFEKIPSTRCQNKDCFMSLTPMVWASVDDWNKRDQTALLQFRSSLETERAAKQGAEATIAHLENSVEILLAFLEERELLTPEMKSKWTKYKDSKTL